MNRYTRMVFVSNRMPGSRGPICIIGGYDIPAVIVSNDWPAIFYGVIDRRKFKRLNRRAHRGCRTGQKISLTRD